MKSSTSLSALQSLGTFNVYNEYTLIVQHEFCSSISDSISESFLRVLRADLTVFPANSNLRTTSS